MEESQDGRSARERPAAAAARSASVYLGKPKQNKAPAGASLLRTGGLGGGSGGVGCWRRGGKDAQRSHTFSACAINRSGTGLNELLCADGRRGNAIDRVGPRAADAEMLAAIHTLTTDDLS